MKRLELSDRDMKWVVRAVTYFCDRLCFHAEEATNSVKLGFPQHYTVEDYIQIWKVMQKVRKVKVLTPTDVKRIKRLYGKRWRGEESYQAFARDKEKKFREWENEQIRKNSK